MCSAPKPKLPDARPIRAIARMPSRIGAANRANIALIGSTGVGRRSLRTGDSIARAQTAAIGGSAVTLG